MKIKEDLKTAVVSAIQTGLVDGIKCDVIVEGTKKMSRSTGSHTQRALGNMSPPHRFGRIRNRLGGKAGKT